MCSDKRQRPRPNSAAGNLPSQLSSPFLFFLSPKRRFPITNCLTALPQTELCFAELTLLYSLPGLFNPGTSCWSPGTLCDRILVAQARSHSPICCCARLSCKTQSPQAACHQHLSMVCGNGAEGSSRLLKRVAGSRGKGERMEPVTSWGPLGNEAASEVGCGFYSRL